MQISNTRAAYGWAAIALHWISAFCMIWLYLAGEAIGDAATREARIPLIMYHASLGACFFVFLFGRVIWSLTQPRPEPLSPNKWLDGLALLVKYAFLALILILLISGPITIWSTGNPIRVFDWFSIPGPFALRSQDVHKIAEKIHIAAHAPLVPLLILHVLGAAFHLLVKKDRTVQRMAWVQKQT